MDFTHKFLMDAMNSDDKYRVTAVMMLLEGLRTQRIQDGTEEQKLLVGLAGGTLKVVEA